MSAAQTIHASYPDGLRPPPFTRADAGPIALLVLCLVAMFWRVLFTSDMLFFRDVFDYSYPHARFIQESCRNALLPFWDPYLNYGEPVLANPNFLFFYPSTLLLILLPINLAYTLHYVLHFALAAVGTYGLARRWGQSRAAAFFAGFVFAFSGPVLSLGNLYNHAAASAWIPWALLLTDVAISSASRRPWILLTFVFSLQFLASEPFTLIATFILCLAYALFETGGLRCPLSVKTLRTIASFAVVGLLMVALSAVQLLPSLSLLANSRRGVEGLPFNETTSWSFHPLHLLEFVVPGFFGSSVDTLTLWTMVLSNRNLPYYLSLFVGAVPLLFAFLGLVLGRDRRRIFAASAVLALLVLAFGRFTPAFAWTYLIVPALALVRFPIKLLIPMLVLVATLAGWGLDALRSENIDWKLRRTFTVWPLGALAVIMTLLWLSSVAFPGAIGAAGGWVLQRTNHMFVRSPAGELTSEQVSGAAGFFVRMLQIHVPGLIGFSLGGLLLVLGLERKDAWARRALPVFFLIGLGQLVWTNYSANPVVPNSFYTYRPPVLSHFKSSGGPYRFAYIFRETEPQQTSPDVQGFVNFDSIPEAHELPPQAQIAFRDRLILARATMLLDVEGVFNIDVERSFPTYLYDFWIYALKGQPDPARAACLMGRTNVRYQVLRSRESLSTLREVAPIFNGSPAPHYLYESLCTTPRTFVARKASRTASPTEALTNLANPSFDPTSEVFLPPEAETAPVADGPAAPARVRIVQASPNSVTLRAALTKPAYIVLLDRFDPNWHATIDGRDATVLRANQLFRAVYCESGRHEIQFVYRQKGLRGGAIISVVTAGLLALVYWRDGKRKDTGA